MSEDDAGELTGEQLEALRELLGEQLEEVQQSLAASKEDAQPVGLDLPIGRLTRMDAMQQQHMAATRRQRLEVQLAQITQALGKLRAGTYGECIRCGDPIGYPRLRVRPETPFCLHCQRGQQR